MSSKLQELYDGWKNNLIPEEKLDPHVRRIAQARMTICNTCPLNSSNMERLPTRSAVRFDVHCTDCGCTLAAKTKSLTSSCPKKKWGAVVIEKK